ncbi:MAG: type II toxin-antitoxin system RelE/ParE family toxin [Marmoricola sp.]
MTNEDERHTLFHLQGKRYDRGTWDIDVELIGDWLKAVHDGTYDQIVAALKILTELGPGLGRPLVDSIIGSRHRNMKELRPGSSRRSEVRILFAFDPKRRAILLLAGDKQGAWAKWYRRNIPVADDRYDEHLEKLKKGGQ